MKTCWPAAPVAGVKAGLVAAPAGCGGGHPGSAGHRVAEHDHHVYAVFEGQEVMWSQVMLCLVLPLTAGAMLRLAADRTLMGKLALQPCAQVTGGVILTVLTAATLLLLGTLLT